MQESQVNIDGLIKTATVFWLYDRFPENGWGWPLDVYFDRKSNTFKVFNCPKEGMTLELPELPPKGLFEFDTEEPVQYARDRFLTNHKVSVR